MLGPVTAGFVVLAAARQLPPVLLKKERQCLMAICLHCENVMLLVPFLLTNVLEDFYSVVVVRETIAYSTRY
jgi:hypothetical protein